MELDKKEKKAIEDLTRLKNLELTFTSYSVCNGKVTLSKEDKIIIDTILNLIEKQQKEIEELQVINKKYKEWGWV